MEEIYLNEERRQRLVSFSEDEEEIKEDGEGEKEGV